MSLSYARMIASSRISSSTCLAIVSQLVRTAADSSDRQAPTRCAREFSRPGMWPVGPTHAAARTFGSSIRQSRVSAFRKAALSSLGSSDTIAASRLNDAPGAPLNGLASSSSSGARPHYRPSCATSPMPDTAVTSRRSATWCIRRFVFRKAYAVCKTSAAGERRKGVLRGW